MPVRRHCLEVLHPAHGMSTHIRLLCRQQHVAVCHFLCLGSFLYACTTSPGHLSLYIIFSKTSYIYCLPLQAHTDELQAALIKAERAILYIIDFEMRIQHPYKIALELTKPPAFNLQKHSIAASNGRYVDITTAIFNVANARYHPMPLLLP